MEQRSMGQFLSALRRAKGMTQAQLAELLGVSDKAVSRWERDVTAPDLFLIPVIAEIFDITADELLRGERNRPEAPEGQRGQKQRERLLKDTAARFASRSLVAAGVALAGLLGAMLVNFGFLRAQIGFFTGCVLYLAAAILEAVFTQWAFHALSEETVEVAGATRRQLLWTAGWTFSAIAVLFFATLPLFALVQGPHFGLSGGSWLGWGSGFALVGAGLSWGGVSLAHVLARKRGLYAFSEAEMARRTRLWQLRQRCLVVLAALLLVTLGAGLLAQPWLSRQETFLEKHTFTDFQEFQAFMRRETASDTGNGTLTLAPEDATEPEYGTRFYIYGPDGETVKYTYLWSNTAVQKVDYTWEGEDSVTFYAYTGARRRAETMRLLTEGYCALVLAEPVVVAAVYLMKKRKL